MKKLFLAFLAAAAITDARAETPPPSWLAFPAFAYLHGVGPVYGAGGGAKNIIAAVSWGEIKAAGIALRDISIFDKRLRLSFGYGLIKEAEFKTTYARGFSHGRDVRQTIKAQGGGVQIQGEFWEERLAASLSLATSFTQFEDYKTDSGVSIPFDTRDLKDFTSNTASLKLIGRLIPERLNLTGSVTAVSGRVGQSDLVWMGIGLNGTHRLNKQWSFAYLSRLQSAKIVKEAATTPINGRCATVADSELRSHCFQLESALTSFITDSNRLGTALPLGGSRGLRSFRELRFKAQNIALSGIEARYDFTWKVPIQLAIFFELGQAADSFSRLYAQSKHSAGIAARMFLNNVPIRLEAAAGNEGPAVFFTAGRAW